MHRPFVLLYYIPTIMQTITKHAFSQWRMKCLSVQGARANVELLMHKEVLQHYFDCWRNAVTFSNSLRYYVTIIIMILYCVSCLQSCTAGVC